MNSRIVWTRIVCVAAAMLALVTGSNAATPPQDQSGVAEISVAGDVAYQINYQGRLTDASGNPLSGTYNLVFQLWNDAAAGTQVGSNITKSNVSVTSGLFTVELDVPQSAFNGQALWLQVQVNGQSLSPRQQLLPVPYAFSLVPGAVVQGDAVKALSVINTQTLGLVGQVNCAGYFRDDRFVGVYAMGSSGVFGVGTGGYGVFGQATGGSNARGVYGSATGASGIGVYGSATGASGVGVYASGLTGVKSIGAEAAGDFQGKVLIRSWSSGNLVMELGEGLDYSEGFDVSGEAEATPGTVLVIDLDNPGQLRISNQPYDTKVAGIVSGANGLGSAIRVGQYDRAVALAGRVYCNVDATEAAVEAGDLLTTSARPGFAMKVADHALAQGAILGKAMEPLAKGQTGQILVLVTLQ